METFQKELFSSNSIKSLNRTMQYGNAITNNSGASVKARLNRTMQYGNLDIDKSP